MSFADCVWRPVEGHPAGPRDRRSAPSSAETLLGGMRVQRIGLWHVHDDGPQKIKTSQVDLERHLEEWIESDPALLRQGLTIVGRQMHVEGASTIASNLDMPGWQSTLRTRLLRL